MKNHEKMKSEGKGFSFDPNDGSKKSKIVTTKEGSRMESNFIIQLPRGFNQGNTFSKKSPTLTSNSWERNNFVMQLNPSTESGGKQPYQQNRIYSAEGKSPAITAQLSTGSNLIMRPSEPINAYYPPTIARVVGRDKGLGKLVPTLELRTDDKCGALTLTQKANLVFTKIDKPSIRRLTPIEVCRLQTVPDDYFFENGVQITADTNAYKMLGNGWTVKVISHFLKHLK